MNSSVDRTHHRERSEAFIVKRGGDMIRVVVVTFSYCTELQQ